MSSRNREGGKRGKIGPKRARPGSRRRSGPALSPASFAAARWPAVHRRVLAAPGNFVRVGRRPRVHQTRPRAARLTRRAVSRKTHGKSCYAPHTTPVQDFLYGCLGWRPTQGPPAGEPLRHGAGPHARPRGTPATRPGAPCALGRPASMEPRGVRICPREVCRRAPERAPATFTAGPSGPRLGFLGGQL